MADEFKKIITIEIDQTVIKNAQKSATELAGRIKQLKEEQKAAKKSGEDVTKEYIERDAQLKALNKQQRTNINILTQANKVTDAAEGSNEKLRAQLSILTAQYNKLSKEERENTEEGKRLGKQVRSITDELKANEKAVGDNRRNVGNYADAIDEALDATTAFGSGLGGMVSGLRAATAASLKFLATPIGAAIGALALAVGAITGAFKLFSDSLNRTEEGSAALAKVTQTFSAIMNGVLKVLEPLATTVMQGVADGFDAIGKAAKGASDTLEKGLRFLGLDKQADSVNNFTNAINDSVKGTRELADAQVELNKIQREQRKLQLEFQLRSEKLRQIRDDESLSIEERKKANQELGEVLEEQTTKELKLAQRALEIAKLRAEVEGESTENLNAIAEAETEIVDIEERIAGQRSEQLTNINSLIREQRQQAKEAAAEKKKQADNEIKAEKERVKAVEQAYIEERQLLDEQAEYQKALAEIEIANAEERAERIAFIEKETLLAKLRSIEDETVAYTASADMIGAVDEQKYAKQLAERAKYEAQLAEIDRAAKVDEFSRQIELLNGQEQLDNQTAELEIENERELQTRKYQIALEYAQKRMELMREEAMLDGVLTEQEKQNLLSVENTIKQLQQTLANPEAPTAAQSLGLSQEDIDKMQLGLTVVSQTLQAVQQATQQQADNRLQEIDNQTEAQIASIEKSGLAEEDKEKKITEVEKKAAKERYKIELAQFKTAKALQIALAVANTATAVMAQLSNPTPYAGFVLAALAAATGAIQIATISSQKPPPPPQFAKGGVLHGKTHAEGGIPISVKGGGMIEAEDKEIILTKGVYQDPILRAKASALNVMGGGVPIGGKYESGGLVRKFAAGGVAMSSQAIMRENEATREIQQTIIQSPPVLVLEDFQNVQGRQIRTETNLQL